MTPELARKVPEAKSHQFYVTADAIVLVSRSDRKIADVYCDGVATLGLFFFLAAELGYWSGYKQLQSVFFCKAPKMGNRKHHRAQTEMGREFITVRNCPKVCFRRYRIRLGADRTKR